MLDKDGHLPLSALFCRQGREAQAGRHALWAGRHGGRQAKGGGRK